MQTLGRMVTDDLARRRAARALRRICCDRPDGRRRLDRQARPARCVRLASREMALTQQARMLGGDPGHLPVLARGPPAVRHRRPGGGAGACRAWWSRWAQPGSGDAAPADGGLDRACAGPRTAGGWTRDATRGTDLPRAAGARPWRPRGDAQVHQVPRQAARKRCRAAARAATRTSAGCSERDRGFHGKPGGEERRPALPVTPTMPARTSSWSSGRTAPESGSTTGGRAGRCSRATPRPSARSATTPEVPGLAVGAAVGAEAPGGLDRPGTDLHQLPRGRPPRRPRARLHQVPRRRQVDRDAGLQPRHDRLRAHRQARRR